MPIPTTHIQWCNLSNVEEELNEKFKENPNYPIKNVVLFAKVTDYSYQPVETYFDSDGNFHIEDKEWLAGAELYVGTNRQFIHKQFIISEDTVKIDLEDYFKTAWDETKFTIFRNGLLINPGVFHYIIPKMENKYLKKMIYSTVTFREGDVVDIYYIESGDDFSRVPISRDTYIASYRYRAKKDNDRLIRIPYPNDAYRRDGNQFFVFHKSGVYLDDRVDYIISADGKYISLSDDYVLPKENVDYLVFCFASSPEHPEIVEDEEEINIDFHAGNAFFKYAYSVESSDFQSGAVRFSPKFDGYTLTSKNILLFSSGTFISPDRYDILDNETLVFNNNYDIANCANHKQYTMVIYDNDADHVSYNIPGFHKMVELVATEDDQHEWKLIQPKFRYRSMIIFKGSTMLNPEKYYFDEPHTKLTLLEEGLDKGRTLHVLFFDAFINDTKMERKIVPYVFKCNPNLQQGTILPEPLHYQDLSDRFFILFIGTVMIPHDCYTIRRNRIFLNNKIVTNVDDEFFENRWFYAVHVQTKWTTDSYERTEDELEKSNQFERDVIQDRIGGTIFTHFNTKEFDPKFENGTITFENGFTKYMLHKPNMLLFGGGKWIDPSRFEVYDNDTLIFNNHVDRRYVQWKNFTMVVLDDKGNDTRYNPSSFLVKRVVADEEGQFVFDVPDVGVRYRTFMIFKNSLFLNRNTRYRLRDDGKSIVLLKKFDFVKKGDAITFVFLDAFAREGQEAQLKQFYFRGDPSGITQVPEGMRRDLYDNRDQMMLFMNGNFLDKSQYVLDSDGKIYINGFLANDIPFDHFTFSVVYVLTFLTKVKDYNYALPVKPAFPVQPNYSMHNAFFEEHHGEANIDPAAASPTFDAGPCQFVVLHSVRDPINSTGELVFDSQFTDYTLGKLNLLLFSDSKLISSRRFNVLSGNRIVFNNAADIAECGSKSYTLIVVTDAFFNGRLASRLILEKSVAAYNGQRRFNIPARFTARRGFMVFAGTEPLGDSEFTYDESSGEITLLGSGIAQNDELTVVGISAVLDDSKRYRKLITCKREVSNVEWRTGIAFPDEFLGDTISYQNMMVFMDGELYTPSDYEIRYGRILPLRPYSFSDEPHTLYYTYLRSEADYATIVRDPLYGISGIIKLNTSYTKYSLCKGNFMLFADGLWVRPEEYEIYDNDTLFITGEDFKDRASFFKWTMLVFSDDADRTELGYLPTFFKSEKLPVEQDNQSVFTFPYLNRDFMTLLVFNSKREMLPIDDASRFELNYEEGTLKLLDPSDLMNAGDFLEFVFLNGHTTTYQRTIMLHETMEVTEYGQYIPYSFYNEDDFNEKYLCMFMNGQYVSYDDYEIRDNKLYLDSTKYSDYPYKLTLVHIISLRHEDYWQETITEEHNPDEGKDLYNITRSYSIMKAESDRLDTGIVGFSPVFSGYNLSKENILLFGKGIWIHPDRFEMLTNSIIQFSDPDDKEASDDTFFAMIILDSIFSDESRPIKTVVRQVTATEDNQTEFEIPTVVNGTSYLIFRGSMLLPTIHNDRVKISEDGKTLTLLHQEDALEYGRSLYFVFLIDNYLDDRRVPKFIQDTFRCSTDTLNGTPIPKEWYNDETFRENDLLIFIGGRHIDKTKYAIRNHTIYITTPWDTTDADSAVHKYQLTVLYLSTEVDNSPTRVVLPWTEEYPETEVLDKVVEIPEDELDNLYGLRYETFYSSGNPPVVDSNDEGYIQFLESYDAYSLDKDNILLFGNGVWIDPDRFELLNNGTIRFFDDEDKEYCDWAHYTMEVFSNRDAYEIYGPHYVKTTYSIEEVTVEEDGQTEFEMPTVDDDKWKSFILFRNGLLQPTTYLERYEWDHYNHKFSLRGTGDDPLKKGTKLSFLYLNAVTTDDQEVQWVQTTFPCLGYETHIDMEFLIYKDTKIDKRRCILFINGSHVSKEQYSIRNNTIYFKGGKALLDDEHLFTLVYLSSADSAEVDVLDKPILDYPSYDDYVDNVIFEERYATPYYQGGSRVPFLGGPIKMELVRSASISATEDGHVKFRPIFKDYDIEPNNVLLFSNKGYIETNRFDFYDYDEIVFKNADDIARATTTKYDMLVIGDSVSYYGAFKKSNCVVEAKTVEARLQYEFDIPIIEHSQSKSLIVFLNGKLMNGYAVDWDLGKVRLNANKPYPAVGDVLTYVFLESNITKERKYTTLEQVNFPVNRNNSTMMPDSIKGMDPSEYLLFYDGILLRESQFTIFNERLSIIGYVVLPTDTIFSVIYLSEKDEPEEGVIRR